MAEEEGTVERVETVGHGPHGVHATVRGHEVTTDRPREMGGEDRGLMASEHVLVALASCQTTTALKVAAKRGVDVRDIRVTADMRFDARSEVTGIHLVIRARSTNDDAAVRRVFDLAERACTISKLLKTPVTREINVET